MLTVKAIESKRDKELAGKGSFHSYKLTVEENGTEHTGVELFQKADSIPPSVGQQIDGTLEDGPYGKKIKKAQRLGGPGGGGFRPRDPKESAAIQHQHSQEMAVRVAIAAGWFKEPFDPTSLEGKTLLDLTGRLASWFRRDIDRGVKEATQTYGQPPVRKDTHPTGQSDVPDEGGFTHPKVEGDVPWAA